MNDANNIPEGSKLKSELEFSTSRSGGPGGQNVNKVNSKVTIRFNIATSQLLSDEQKTIVLEKLATRINSDGMLILASQEKRSQIENKEAVVEKLEQLLKKALTRKKKRRKTKPTKASKEERVKSKKKLGEKKQWRQKL